MAAKKCSMCGATAHRGCECAPRTAEEAVAAAFDPFRPRTMPEKSVRRTSPSLSGARRDDGTARKTEAKPEPAWAAEAVVEPAGDEGPRGRGRRKAVMTASAVAFAVLGAFLLTTGLSDDDTRSGDESTPRNPTQVATNDTSPDGEEAGTSSGSADAGTPTASAATASSSAGTDKDTGGAGGGGASKAPKPPATGGNPTDGGATGNPAGGAVGGGEVVPPVLKEGDHGPEVVELQKRLRMSPADGVYDKDVTRRVRRFQRKAGITDDPPGVYGPSTRQALESLASSRPDHEDDDDD